MQRKVFFHYDVLGDLLRLCPRNLDSEDRTISVFK